MTVELKLNKSMFYIFPIPAANRVLFIAPV